MPGEEDQRSSLLAGSDVSDTKPDSPLPPAILYEQFFQKSAEDQLPPLMTRVVNNDNQVTEAVDSRKAQADA